MPDYKHNSQKLVDRIIRQSEDVKSVLRELVLFAKTESKNDAPPKRLIEVLKQRSLVLSESIKEYTIQHTRIDINEKGETTTIIENNVAEELNDISKYDPKQIFETPKSEFILYNEFGFTREEYEQLLIFQKDIHSSEVEIDYSSAFNQFVELLQKDDKEINEDWRKLIPAATGLIGIASDIVTFHASGNITVLYFSCSSGLLSIAGAFKSVKNKLLRLFKN